MRNVEIILCEPRIKKKTVQIKNFFKRSSRKPLETSCSRFFVSQSKRDGLREVSQSILNFRSLID